MPREGHAIGSHGVALMGCHVRGVALRLVPAGSAPASSLRREVRPPATLPATLPARPASFLSEGLLRLVRVRVRAEGEG